jgi:hypothetical protein
MRVSSHIIVALGCERDAHGVVTTKNIIDLTKVVEWRSGSSSLGGKRQGHYRFFLLFLDLSVACMRDTPRGS